MQVSGWGNTLRILHRCPKIHLADHSSIATLANTFSSFFINVTEWRRFLLASFRSDLVKQIFNDQTSKVQLFTEFITDILYVHDVSSL